jgi:hypothetical protein
MSRVAPGDRGVLGWREWVSLPALGIDAIKVKVDTGARSSAIHAFEIERFRRRKREMVRFLVHPLQRDVEKTVECEAEVHGERHVRPSAGSQDLRIVVVTDLECNGLRWPIELTLAARDQMGFRMLLGRQAIRGNFVVDPGRSYQLGRRTRTGRPRVKKDGRRSKE